MKSVEERCQIVTRVEAPKHSVEKRSSLLLFQTWVLHPTHTTRDVKVSVPGKE